MKRREIKKYKIIHFLDKGYSIKLACFYANVGRATFYRWLIQDPTFKRLVNKILDGSKITVVNWVFPFIHRKWVSEL